MDELIVRLLTGELTEIERARLDRWRRASPENERQFQAAVAGWDAVPGARSDQEPPPVPRAEEIVAAASAGHARWVPGLLGSWRRWGVAAILAGVMAVGGVWVTREDVVTASDGTYLTVPLADGSVVRLAPGARLGLRSRGANRRVSLEGRAFFAVVSDPARPFRIRSRAGDATVLGTRFELRAGAVGIEVVVVEGRVRMAGRGGAVDVRGGQRGRVERGGAPIPPESVDVYALLDWPNGVLLFSETPLAVVAAELEAQFGQRLVLADTTLAQRTVTAWFEDQPFDHVVADICRILGAQCTIGAGRAVMVP